VLQTLFPRSCCSCGKGPWPFCNSCLVGLRPLGVGRSCRRCWAPATGDECRQCPPDPLSMTRSAFRFEGSARAAVLRMKFGGEGAVASALGGAMAAVSADLLPVDLVTWVPLSQKRLSTRGYDQARLLARRVSRELNLPARRMLGRVRDIPPQARSGADQRVAAIEGIFVSKREAPASVLLVDDVLTTGATASECARVLMMVGAERVVLLTAARSMLRSGDGAVLSSVRFQSGSVVARGVSPR